MQSIECIKVWKQGLKYNLGCILGTPLFYIYILKQKMGWLPSHAPSGNTEGEVIAMFQHHFIIPTFPLKQNLTFTENQFVNQIMKKSLISNEIEPHYP